MYYQDARLPYGIPAIPTYGMSQFHRPDVYNPGIVAGQELAAIHARIDEIRYQIDVLCQLVRQQQQLTQATLGFNQAFGQPAFGLNQNLAQSPIAYGQNVNAEAYRSEFSNLPYANSAFNRASGNLRTRENDTHIILEIFLPHLSMGDVDVEISGNRIICRTRVPVNPAGRWWLNAQLPRGLELFELADGRVEFGWLVPVAFQAKEVEASWRDGFMCIYVPKADAASARQNVQVVRDSKSRKTADMNS